MKTIVLLMAVAVVLATGACKKDQTGPGRSDIPANYPRTEVPGSVQGNWMYGYFSLTEYWSQNPADYIGSAFEIAIAFSFAPDGTYTQYFTSSSVFGGKTTYQQSVTRGTVEVDVAHKTITTHPYSAHYRRTANGHVEEEKDMDSNEVTAGKVYSFQFGTEPNGTKAIHLKMEGTADFLPFLQKL